MDKREVKFSSFIKLLMDRRPFSILGILFVFVPLFVIISLLLTFSSHFSEPYQNYNFANINKFGVEKTAVITGFRAEGNTSINGKNPEIISYSYNINGQKAQDKFQTLNYDNLKNLEVGKEIKIKVYNNESSIVNLIPFKFPEFLFYLFPLIFLIPGIVFLLISFIPSLKYYNLYKKGIVKEAEIVNVELNQNVVSRIGFNSYRTGTKRITVNYFFLGKNNKRIFGKSVTTDYSFLNEKKSGDKIKIFVGENDENMSCLIPKLESLKYNWNIQ